MRPLIALLFLLAAASLAACPPQLRGGTPPADDDDTVADDDDTTWWDDDDATGWDDDDITTWDDDDWGAWLSVSPEELYFGMVPVGEEAWQTLVLYNQGDRDVFVYEVWIEGEPEPWQVRFDLELWIPAWTEVAVDIGFLPIEPRYYEGWLALSTDADNGEIWLLMSGEGVDAMPPPGR